MKEKIEVIINDDDEYMIIKNPNTKTAVQIYGGYGGDILNLSDVLDLFEFVGIEYFEVHNNSPRQFEKLLSEGYKKFKPVK